MLALILCCLLWKLGITQAFALISQQICVDIPKIRSVPRGKLRPEWRLMGPPSGSKGLCVERGERKKRKVLPPSASSDTSGIAGSLELRREKELNLRSCACLICKLCDCVSFKYLLMMMSRRARTTRVIMIFICGKNSKETAVDACEKHKGVTH